MAINQELKRRAKQPTTQAGLLALMIAPMIMPDVDWKAVRDAIAVIYDQIPMMKAGIVALMGIVGSWNFLRDEDKDA